MKSKSKFILSAKPGYSIKNGMLYEFKRHSVNVSRPWPPCKYTKTRKKPFWHYSPTHKISLHFTALQYSVAIEKGMINEEDRQQNTDDSSKIREGESLIAIRNADEIRKMAEDAFWQKHELPVGYLQVSEALRKSMANQRKWTPVIASFYDRIPLPVREMMLVNSEGAWNICAFYSRCPGAAEVMANSPAIGFMLSNFPVFRPKLKRKWDAVRRIMNKPRRKILAWLGWPDSEVAAKILSRIKYPACEKRSLLMLRALFKKNPGMIKPMSHLKAINSASLSIICRNSHRNNVSWRFIGEVGLMEDKTDEPMGGSALEIQRMLIDTLSMEKTLLLSRGPIMSIAHLSKRHQLAIDEVNRHEMSELEKAEEFPDPPVPVPIPMDDFEIYPVDTPLKLYKEAQEQHNCVFASYRERIVGAEGNFYIYSMHKPERATVAVEFENESGIFLPGEIKGPLNKDVSNNTLSKIIVWLSVMGKKKPPLPLHLDEYSSDRILPAFPVLLPKADDSFTVTQVTSLKRLLSEMSQYNISPDPNIMSQIEGGRTFAFLMELPEKAFVFVSRDKSGTFTYSPFKNIRITTIGHDTESRLNRWVEEATILNLATCDPDQMSFEFSGTGSSPSYPDTVIGISPSARQFLRFLPQEYTNADTA